MSTEKQFESLIKKGLVEQIMVIELNLHETVFLEEMKYFNNFLM